MTRLARQVAVVGALILLLGGFFPAAAIACDCVAPGTACAAVVKADAVFVGRVTSLTADGVQFDVERAVTAVTLGAVSVGNPPSTCALTFNVGERYIVYAYRDHAGELSTNMCTRTRRLNTPYARSDIAYFDHRERKARGGLLTGVVADGTQDRSSVGENPRPIAGVRVTVTTGNGGRVVGTAVTRADGSYELTGLPSGRLRIVASLPSQFAPHEPVTVVMAQGCAEGHIISRSETKNGYRVPARADRNPNRYWFGFFGR